MSEYRWKDVSVVGFDELMNALDRADRKGYMPDALKEEWEAFNWKPAQSQQEPVAWIDEYGNAFPLAAKQYSVVGKHWKPLYTSPPAQRTWVGLTHEDIKEAEWLLSAIKEHEAYTLQEQLLVEGVDVFARAIEAKLREKNT